MVDRRSRRSQRLIKEAFYRLIVQKPLFRLTVAEITREADLERGTFYGHYHDVFDLYDQELAAHVDTLLALFKRHYLTAFDKHDFVPLFSSIINYLTTNQELQALMHEAYNKSRALAEITHAFQTTVTLSEVAVFGGQNDLATQLEINYNLAGVLTILTDWQKGNINASVTELTTSPAAIARHYWQ
ncbi:TetR/AcrR family transcriptional regulator [Limosilactobacillus fermentum]